MTGLATSTASFRQKALREFKEMAALALYLYVYLGAVVLLKAAVLQDAGVNFVVWGVARVKALLLAKFMLHLCFLDAHCTLAKDLEIDHSSGQLFTTHSCFLFCCLS
jgi:hypothetical protein